MESDVPIPAQPARNRPNATTTARHMVLLAYRPSWESQAQSGLELHLTLQPTSPLESLFFDYWHVKGVQN